MGYEEHISKSQSIKARCAVVTLSDTRTAETDKSGQHIKSLLEQNGHTVAHQTIIPDNPQQLNKLLDDLVTRPEIDVILTNGGTGISRRDQTIPVIEKRLTIPLPGFGELFRTLSYEQIGSGAILSRAIGGVAHDKLLFAMPGSTKAVDLAMTKLILPELGHLISELRKG